MASRNSRYKAGLGVNSSRALMPGSRIGIRLEIAMIELTHGPFGAGQAYIC